MSWRNMFARPPKSSPASAARSTRLDTMPARCLTKASLRNTSAARILIFSSGGGACRRCAARINRPEINFFMEQRSEFLRARRRQARFAKSNLRNRHNQIGIKKTGWRLTSAKPASRSVIADNNGLSAMRGTNPQNVKSGPQNPQSRTGIFQQKARFGHASETGNAFLPG